MKKTFAFALAALLALPALAAPAKKAKTAPKEAPKPTVEFVVVESEQYQSGKHSPQISASIANFLGGVPSVKTVSYTQAKQDPALAEVDMTFLPVYMVKKNPQVREKLDKHLAAGYATEKGEYIVLARVARTGVYEGKEAKTGLLELFVMSQCPYGAMAENLVIDAQKAGQIPADKTIKLRYIVNYNEKTGFQSLHGSAEWEENIRQLLIAKYYPKKLWKYLEIRNKDYRSSRWDKAMKEAGINPNKIMKKFDTEGVELLKAEAAYVNEYAISASPSFLWEGKEVLDFGSVSQKEGLEFLNPARGQKGAAAAPAGSC